MTSAQSSLKRYDPVDRISASQALAHPLFAGVPVTELEDIANGVREERRVKVMEDGDQDGRIGAREDGIKSNEENGSARRAQDSSQRSAAENGD